MEFKMMGFIEYGQGADRKLKVVGRKNGVVTARVIKHPGKKLDFKRITDIAASEMKVKTSDVKIPKHIEYTVKGRE